MTCKRVSILLSLGLVLTPLSQALAQTGLPPIELHQVTGETNPEQDKPVIYTSPEARVAPFLKPTDLSVSWGSIKLEPVLNVVGGPDPIYVKQGTEVTFQTYWNYGPWIDRAEVRIFEEGRSYLREPDYIVPIGPESTGTWTPPRDLKGDFIYVLRVYNEQSLFDETLPKALHIVRRLLPRDTPTTDEAMEIAVENAYGVNYTRTRNIHIAGSVVTVHGRDVPEGTEVKVFNRHAPVDLKGEFVSEEIVRPGLQVVTVEYWQAGQLIRVVQRDVQVPESETVFIALGDFTFGEDLRGGPLYLDDPLTSDQDESKANGRAAFYVRSRLKNGVGITAKFDTGYEAVEDMFTNFDEKDPRYLFRRIDPEAVYPTYGDDSTTIETAPTQGKIFLKLEKGDSHFVWGNYTTDIVDTEFSQIERGLYGAKVKLVSPHVTSFGERKADLELYGAEPGTVPAREEFRATGGSVYFLQHQDLSIGSERLRIEIRDHESGLVRESLPLMPREDYDIDYLQGRVFLTQPLSAYSSDGHIVRDGNLSGHDVHLVVHYEYTPGLTEFEGWSYGGRASAWLTDYFQVGLTGRKEETGDADQQQYGVDLTLRNTQTSYWRAEWSRTEGPAFGAVSSFDGGFNYEDLAAGLTADQADAWRIEAQIDTDDYENVIDGLMLASYFEHRDASLSSLGRLTVSDTDQWGYEVRGNLTSSLEIRSSYDEIDRADGLRTRDVSLDLIQDLSEDWSIGLGYRHELDEGVILLPTPINRRRDDFALQLDYDPDEMMRLYTFAQTTSHDKNYEVQNERAGAGFSFVVSDKMDIGAEVSGGDGGLGSQVNARFHQADGTDYYLAYQTDPDRSNTGTGTLGSFDVQNGTLTVGSRQRFSDSLSVYGEERYQSGNKTTGISHSWGLDFRPTKEWQFGGSIENGTIEFDDGKEMVRDAYSVTIGFTDDQITFATSYENRQERSALEERDTFVSRTMLDFNGFDNWTMINRLNWMESDSDQGDFFDGEFIEASMGFAYRPILNDRLNVLSKYTLFYDLPSAQQITPSGLTPDFKQRSHIFAVDAIYDLSERWSLGAKYGVRVGEITTSRTTDDFFDSTAHLGIVRLDWHVVKNWDFLAEQRWLHTEENDDTRDGTLLVLYRHFGDHFKAGVGYNFADFSDRLTNPDYDDEGVFFNFISKY